VVEGRTERIQVPPGVTLHADVVVPSGAAGVVIFAHGSGSSRHSPRNRFVAERLQQAGLATVLADLLTVSEERQEATTGHLRFDVEMLAGRLTGLTRWAQADPILASLPTGYFGASTGAAAALIAAASDAGDIAAIVSRGGRPDLAGSAFRGLSVPVLLIVGGADHVVLDLNRRALEELGPTGVLKIVPGATHLFAEPGALEVVADEATAWFVRHLTAPPGGSPSPGGP
jgi:putative phosphoribosyl transferase